MHLESHSVPILGSQSKRDVCPWRRPPTCQAAGRKGPSRFTYQTASPDGDIAPTLVCLARLSYHSHRSMVASKRPLVLCPMPCIPFPSARPLFSMCRRNVRPCRPQPSDRFRHCNLLVACREAKVSTIRDDLRRHLSGVAAKITAPSPAYHSASWSGQTEDTFAEHVFDMETEEKSHAINTRQTRTIDS